MPSSCQLLFQSPDNIKAFAALRIFALYGLNKSLFALVLFVGFLNPSTQIVNSSNISSSSTKLISCGFHPLLHPCRKLTIIQSGIDSFY